MAINPSKFDAAQLVVYLVLLPLLALLLLPILYIVFTAFKPIGELFAYPPRFITTHPTPDNFRRLFEATENTLFPLSIYLFNSIVSTGIVVVAGIFISVAAAYVLSKKRFHGRSLIFKLNTLSMMFVPTAVSIPRYLVIKQVGLLDTFWANVVPMLAMPVGIFLVKQFVDQLPEELVESARIDGSGEWRTFWRIVMPLVKPAWLTLIIFSFQGLWKTGTNVLIQSEDLKTLNYALTQIVAGGIARSGTGAAATIVMMSVPVVIFVISQSNIVETMATSGMKD